MESLPLSDNHKQQQNSEWHSDEDWGRMRREVEQKAEQPSFRICIAVEVRRGTLKSVSENFLGVQELRCRIQHTD